MDVSHFIFMHKDHHDLEINYYRASRRKANLISRVFFLTPLALIMGNIFATILLTKASMANYPGGQALTNFHQSFSNITSMQFTFELYLEGHRYIHPFSPTPYPHIQSSSSKRRFSFPSTPFLSSLPSSIPLHRPWRMELQQDRKSYHLRSLLLIIPRNHTPHLRNTSFQRSPSRYTLVYSGSDQRIWSLVYWLGSTEIEK